MGDTETVKFAFWIPLSVAAGSIVSVVLGWFIRSFSERFGYAAMFLGTLGIVLLAPGLMLDYAEATRTHFAMRTGFWFSPTQHKVDFQDIASVSLTKQVNAGKRRSTNYTLECHLTSGQVEKIPVGDLMKHGGLQLFTKRVATNNIPFADLTGD